MREFAAIALAAAASMMPSAIASHQSALPADPYSSGVEKPVRKKKLAPLASVPRKYRSRGAQAKPAKRKNMSHVSRRVRRKHRRAA